jgi:hypothetical protein
MASSQTASSNQRPPTAVSMTRTGACCRTLQHRVDVQAEHLMVEEGRVLAAILQLFAGGADGFHDRRVLVNARTIDNVLVGHGLRRRHSFSDFSGSG